MSDSKVSKVCPHCLNVFTNEYTPDMLAYIKQVSDEAERIPLLMAEERFKEVSASLGRAVMYLGEARRSLCDVWDSTDSAGYAAFCEEGEDG